MLAVGDLELQLRPMVPADDPYICSCAVRTVRLALEFRRMDGSDFHRTRTPGIRATLAHAPLRAVVCLPEDPAFIVAFVLGIPGDIPILHYLHVRGSFCRQGIAATLASASLGIVRDRLAAYTLPTPALDRIGRRGTWPLLVHRGL